ncbi:MAG: hypothetical protein AAGJ35_00220 [Myxococcota bacterium]
MTLASSSGTSLNQRLQHIEKRCRAVTQRPLWSMSEAKREVTPFHKLLDLPQLQGLSHEQNTAWVDAFCTVLDTLCVHFPGNLFWDMDFFVHALAFRHTHSPIQREMRTAEQIRTLGQHITTLHEIFGNTSTIRFRYVHDFLYGFDWARWMRKRVAKAPEKVSSHSAQTSSVSSTTPTETSFDPEREGPFDRGFLDYLQKRAGELENLIQNNDQKYPKIKEDEHRNPFSFSRTPEDEFRLHRQLALTQDIPILGWDPEGPAEWKKDASHRRQEMAQMLTYD